MKAAALEFTSGPSVGKINSGRSFSEVARSFAGFSNPSSGVSSKILVPPRPRLRVRTSEYEGILGESRMPRLAAFVKSQQFEGFIAVLILINCGTMGLQAEGSLGNVTGWEVTTSVCEYIFTFVFLVELMLRILFFGIRKYIPFVPMLWAAAADTQDNAQAVVTFSLLDSFDALLVIISIASLAAELRDEGSSILSTFSVLRALRLLRLVRIVRKLQAFHEVWLLLRGLMDSCRTLVWTVVVIFAVTYIFAVFGVVLISPRIKAGLEEASQENGAELEGLWDAVGSIPAVMYTLIQVLTLDSWTSVSRPLKKYVWWSWVFFYLYICVAVFVLMNLVTAIIVENALKHSQNDEQLLLEQKERKRVAMMDQFRGLFQLMDQDGDGELNREEFEQAFATEEVSTRLKLLDFGPDDCRELFYLLDTGDGALSLEEFFNGLTRMEGAASAKDVFRIMKGTEQLERLFKQFAFETSEDLDDIMRSASGCKLRKRPGTLKKRANTAALKAGERDSGGENESAFNTADNQPKRAMSAPKVQLVADAPRDTPNGASTPADLRLVLDRLDKLAQQVDQCSTKIDLCRREYNARLDTNEHMISMLANDVAALRLNLVAQAQQTAPSREFARAPTICSSAFKALPEQTLT